MFVSRCCCLGVGVMMLVTWCWCHGVGVVMLVQWSSCHNLGHIIIRILYWQQHHGMPWQHAGAGSTGHGREGRRPMAHGAAPHRPWPTGGLRRGILDGGGGQG